MNLVISHLAHLLIKKNFCLVILTLVKLIHLNGIWNFFFNDREIEIIAIVEGNDEYTSRLIQARHSYKLEDLGFWRTFSPAVGRLPDGSCRIDFSHFHRTVRVRA
mmetsp:Transcript_18502/g.22439  ORF Transcript_18502/g.22439 Transcript_18502/m.22439 type:complete len:105 (-) Transcript_18502:76-390(-)